MSKVITPYDPEMEDILAELYNRTDAIKAREKLSQDSFKTWVMVQIQDIASKLGYIIEGLSEFIKDLGYSFNKGFQEGRQRARENSYRYNDRKKGNK